MYNGDKAWVIIGGSIILSSVFLQLYITPCGLLLNHDSFEYLAAAKSFGDDGTIRGIDGTPFIYWPPLYPVFLSAFDYPLAIMPWIHAFLTILIGFMLFQFASRYLEDNTCRTVFMVSTMWGVQQLLISVFLWSEILFLVLTLLFVECVIRSMRLPTALAAAFIFGTLMCLQRNAGLFIVLACVIWVTTQSAARITTTLRATTILACAAGGIWWNTTHLWVDSYAESNVTFGTYVGHNLLLALDGITGSITPFTVIAIPISVLLAIAPFIFFWKKRDQHAGLFLFVLITCSYVAGMALMFRLDPGEADRYTAPVMPFVLLPVFKMIEGFLNNASLRWRTMIALAMIVWLFFPVLRTMRNARQWHDAACQVTATGTNRVEH